MTPYTSTPDNNRGTFHRWRAFWFGETDPTAQSLKELERQGSHVARVARFVSILLVFLFSAASLIALAGNTLQAFTKEWKSGDVNIPAAISLGVTFLLVIAMDTAMIYAGIQVRTLMNRHAPKAELRIHQFVMIGVCVVEAGTYAYMSYLYEHPNNVVAWALILARALSAPFLTVYLTLARTVPITARDILYQAELTAGRGVLADVATIAGDPTQPLSTKAGIFLASAEMSGDDQGRFGGMIQVVEGAQGPRFYVDSDPNGGPNGGGTPMLLPLSQDHETVLRQVENVLWRNPEARASEIATLVGISETDAKRAVVELAARGFKRQAEMYTAAVAG